MSNGINASIGLKGSFLIEVKHADGTSDHYEFENMVLNQGLDAIGSGPPANTSGNIINGITVGTGNSTPVATQTALDAAVGYTTSCGTITTTAVSTTSPYVLRTSYPFTFSVGGAVGNIAEIGCLMAGETAAGRCFSRALIQVGGSPGTITLLSTDQLIVTYQLDTYYLDQSGSLNVVTDGTSVGYTYQVKPIAMYQNTYTPTQNQRTKISMNNGGSGPGWYTGIGGGTAFQAVTAQPTSGTSGYIWYNSTVATGTYTAGSYQLTFTFPIGTAHPTASLQFACFASQWGCFQLLFNAAPALLTTQTLSWPVTFQWGRYP